MATDLQISPLPWNLELVPLLLAYLLAAALWREHARMFLDRHAFSVTITALAVLAALHVLSDAVLDLGMRRYDSIVVCTLESFTGILLVMGVSTLVSRRKDGLLARWLSWIGLQTLPVLVFHGYVLGKVYFMVSAAAPGLPPAVAYSTSFVAGLLCPIFLWQLVLSRLPLIKYWFPRVKAPLLP